MMESNSLTSDVFSATLYETMPRINPGIAEMAVASTPDPLLGHAVKAVLVLREGATLDERQVKAHCREKLASYKVPKVVEFAHELPRTSSGKVQRFKLA